MSSALVIGSDGLIGGAVVACLDAAGWQVDPTTRREDETLRRRIDLLCPPEALPASDVAVLCAGINGAEACEGKSFAWRINVDGVLAVGRNLIRNGVFVIY